MLKIQDDIISEKILGSLCENLQSELNTTYKPKASFKLFKNTVYLLETVGLLKFP